MQCVCLLKIDESYSGILHYLPDFDVKVDNMMEVLVLVLNHHFLLRVAVLLFCMSSLCY